MRDRFGRPLTHMRISVTLRCNHKCIFCHREGISDSSPNELDPGDYEFLARVASGLGIRNYKITGGEPLVRSDVHEIVRGMKPYSTSISMTTNGSLLELYAQKLVEAGLDYANVSIHSLKPGVFKYITSGDLERVLRGFEKALDVGLRLKIDYLVLKYNVEEYKDILEFASARGVDVNVIELIPLGISFDEWKSMHASLDPIVEFLEKNSKRLWHREFQHRPTYELDTGINVTVIRGYGNPSMCMNCSRIRLTPDGKFKTCIFRNDTLVDAYNAIKSRDEDSLKNLIHKANMLREPFFKKRL